MYLAIIILPLLGSIVSGFLLQPFFYSSKKLDYLFTQLKAKFHIHFCIFIALFLNLFIIIFSGNALVIASLLILLLSLSVLYYLVFSHNKFKRNYPVLFKFFLFFFSILIIISLVCIFLFLLYFYMSFFLNCFSMLKKYFTYFKHNGSNGGKNSEDPKNVFGDVSKKKKKRNFDKELWKKHMYNGRNARALDKRYEDLLIKICLKYELPVELRLQILSHIKDMVNHSYKSRAAEWMFNDSVSYKVGNAVWIRDRRLLSRKEFLAWQRRVFYDESCEFASVHYDEYMFRNRSDGL